MTEIATIAPVRKSVQVACDPAHAFDVFTRGIARGGRSSQRDPSGRGTRGDLEGREGGEVYEISNGGVKAHWATVLAWDPPSGLTIAWHVNPDAVAATEIEVGSGPRREERASTSSTATGSGSADAAEARGNYDEGWETVLARFAAHVG